MYLIEPTRPGGVLPVTKPRVAIVGAGPAGCYAADLLASTADATVDLFDRLPTPFGLVRYGVAPDHPRIKEIIKALHRVMDNPALRFFGNVRYGTDLRLDDLRERYDAVIFATGAERDRPLPIPGILLPGSFGAADFVAWYDAHPEAPAQWPLEATDVAIIGAGNVALDVARMLAKPVAEQGATEICAHVRDGLARNQARTIHVFARRGPAHVKFTPVEFRELSHSPEVDVVVEENGFEIDEAGQELLARNKSARLVADTMYKYLERGETGGSRRIVIHLCQAPVEIIGDSAGVTALRTERTRYNGDGTVSGTGEFVETPVQAVYRAVGYAPDPVPGVPFDAEAGTVRNVAGRVVDESGAPVPGVYATGWVKRGPVGLIGHTKSDAAETVRNLVADLAGRAEPGGEVAAAAWPLLDGEPVAGDMAELLAGRGVQYTTWEGWLRIDARERALGAAEGRARVKLATRAEMLAAAHEVEDAVEDAADGT